MLRNAEALERTVEAVVPAAHWLTFKGDNFVICDDSKPDLIRLIFERDGKTSLAPNQVVAQTRAGSGPDRMAFGSTISGPLGDLAIRDDTADGYSIFLCANGDHTVSLMTVTPCVLTNSADRSP